MTATITRRMKKKVTVSRPLGGEEKHKDGMNALNYSAVHKFAMPISCNENTSTLTSGTGKVWAKPAA